MSHIHNFDQGTVLLIDKPLRWTSFDVIRKIRSIIKVKKVGHAGTLDPLATGLLIVCTGFETKNIHNYVGMQKEYTGTITLGASTPTFDLESIPENQKDISDITNERIQTATHQFIGSIKQMPPIHSAIKQHGKPVYLQARKGVEVIMEPRSITIDSFEITEINLPIVSFKVSCSTGTYIRSLANDFGNALGCGGYLSQLCRTRIGDFKIENALTIEQFEKDEKAKKDNRSQL